MDIEFNQCRHNFAKHINDGTTDIKDSNNNGGAINGFVFHVFHIFIVFVIFIFFIAFVFLVVLMKKPTEKIKRAIGEQDLEMQKPDRPARLSG